MEVEDGKFNCLSRQFYVRGLGKLDRVSSTLLIRLLGGTEVLIDSGRFVGLDKIGFARRVRTCWYCDDNSTVTRLEINREALLSLGGDNAYENAAIRLLPLLMPSYLLEEFKSRLKRAKAWDDFKKARREFMDWTCWVDSKWGQRWVADVSEISF